MGFLTEPVPARGTAVAMLPEAAKSPLRSVFGALVETMAPIRDGLRWIDVSDPQLRKSAKLQTSRR